MKLLKSLTVFYDERFSAKKDKLSYHNIPELHRNALLPPLHAILSASISARRRPGADLCTLTNLTTNLSWNIVTLLNHLPALTVYTDGR